MNLEENNKDRKLGDYSLQFSRFPGLKDAFCALENEGFLSLPGKDRLESLHKLLLRYIDSSKTPCFLLPAINEFIWEVNQRKLVSAYTFSGFEFWLNNFSGLGEKENYLVRGKITGKYVPRETYQVVFPIGAGKKYPGSHYVTAHGSPDLDTTVASFWGWVDAFSARVGAGLHIWNIPGGPPESQVEIDFLFHSLIGKGCFDHFAKTRTALALSAADLLTQAGVVIKNVEESSEKMDDDTNAQSVILVDSRGYYRGDWRRSDRDAVRKVMTLLHTLMRSFVSHFQRKLTALFAEKTVTKQAFEAFLGEAFSALIADADPVKEFTDKQKKKVDTYLSRVLFVERGLAGSFKELWAAMEKLSLTGFAGLYSLIEKLPESGLFDPSGNLVENRPAIFEYVGKIVSELEMAIQSLKTYVNGLGVAYLVKKEVFGLSSAVVSQRAEPEEIRNQIGSLPYVTVTVSDEEENEHPVGIVRAVDLMKPVLGTVSLRDFCNRDETKIPSYFEVISVVDHHKSSLATTSAPVATIGDSQSANALTAELAFRMHDDHVGSEISKESLLKRLSSLNENTTDSELRVMGRLLGKQTVNSRKTEYFIDPLRESFEYLQYLHAILDDTDLLSKVSYRDVICVGSLLNRLKSLFVGEETEIITFDDLVRDEKFVSEATRRILKNEDMYSLYKKIYLAKEEAVEKNIAMCVKGLESTVFADTKVQNGCNRVGQSKFFAKNFPSYLKDRAAICSAWYAQARKFHLENPDCDLHLHMISTIPGADEMYAGSGGGYAHMDELWIWIPSNEEAIGHLKSFLDAFRHVPQIAQSTIEAEFFGESEKLMQQIFRESFKLDLKKTHSSDKKMSAPVVVLRYGAGLLNSRKAMISPYLPKLA